MVSAISLPLDGLLVGALLTGGGFGIAEILGVGALILAAEPEDNEPLDANLFAVEAVTWIVLPDFNVTDCKSFLGAGFGLAEILGAGAGTLTGVGPGMVLIAETVGLGFSVGFGLGGILEIVCVGIGLDGVGALLGGALLAALFAFAAAIALS